MPTYQYRCEKCGKRFERTETISEHAAMKPQCPRAQRHLRGKLIKARLPSISPYTSAIANFFHAIMNNVAGTHRF